ncbi:MAG TPA: DUF1345 domain-containing protein [Sphingomonas sp.]|nr:DUF1345 domain-containing protein [Sphingomonas sp.]
MAITELQLGNRIAPPRFLAFTVIMIIGTPIGISQLGWAKGAMAAFDVASIIFFATIVPLLGDKADGMRRAAKRNDANRAGLLALTVIVSIVVLSAVASELTQPARPPMLDVALIVGTLMLSWLFSSLIYALHYAHIFYGEDKGRDVGGIDFPGTKEPDYWDFLYFSTCLSMTFQVSDMDITSGRMRRVIMFHCLAAFVFNLGIVAFTINVLGGG